MFRIAMSLDRVHIRPHQQHWNQWVVGGVRNDHDHDRKHDGHSQRWGRVRSQRHAPIMVERSDGRSFVRCQRVLGVHFF